MEIFIGPAGNVQASKEPGTEGSLKWIKENGLNAQEIEFVRNVYLTQQRAEAIGKLAKELGIRLSIHAPYFINLASESKQVLAISKRLILDSADRGERCCADTIAIHAAYYYHKDPKKTFDIVKKNFEEILEEMKARGIKNIKLGVETMARETQFGTLDEVIKLCKEINHKQLVPYIDFAHIFCKNNGKIDYAEIFDRLEDLKLKHINSHFEGVKYNVSSKKFVDVHTQMNSHPPFEPLAKEILKRKLNITIIAESKPSPEKDALKIKSIFDKLRKQ
ncbi:MAG: TIM barrel protein [Candidatus Aenigmatarchaeota archaeon]